MSQARLPPPDRESCLVRLRSSTQKGGTIIVEDVTDLAAHEVRLRDPDGYRPKSCPKCGARRLHVHDYRERVLRGEREAPVAQVVRYACVACEAIWLTLPWFLARHLWRTWGLVEHVLLGTSAGGGGRRWPRVPERTQRRWRARWHRPGNFLGQVLAASGEAVWASLVSSAATCADLVAGYARATATAAGHLLAAVAALIDRLQPKVRLM